MIRVLIVDDEPLARNVLKEYLSEDKRFEIIAECGDGFEAVKLIQQLNPDLIFLDIQMPRMSGFETLELIDKKPAVIFTTAFDEYAIKAFEINAIDYLLKPFGNDRFFKAIEKFMSQGHANSILEKLQTLENTAVRTEDEANRIVVKNGSSILILPIDQVVYLEAHDDYVKVFNQDTFFLKKKTMSYYEDVLNMSRFIRIHRSYLLNVDYLTRIEPLDKNNSLAVLRSGVKLPISRSGLIKLKSTLKL